MDIIPLLRLRKNAIRDCSTAEELSPELRAKLVENLKVLDVVPWASKGVVLLGIVLGVDWRKSVPMSRRELPLAAAAIGFCALSDYLASEYVWRQHESEINGIYVSPDRMRKMRERSKLTLSLGDLEDDLLIENDDPQ